MADEQVYDAVKMYLSGRISRQAFWGIAKFRYPTHQISFNTTAALGTLKYLHHKEPLKND